jgi:3-oxoacyl-[acyl-carrier protein] reductase
MKQLEGKVAIVTGASKGIGAGIAKTFALDGARVVINYASDKAGAEKTAVEIEKSGGQAFIVKADVGKENEAQALVHETVKRFGKLDTLVNNAGVFRFTPFTEIDEKYFDWMMKINVLGPVLMTKAALPHFSKSGSSVVNLSSVLSQSFIPGMALYSASKAAINSLTGALAIELAPKGIRVNAILPGATDTEGAHTLGMLGGDSEKQVIAATPLGRIGLPEDIANLAAFLASDAASWLTGEIVRSSGGMR